MSNEATTPVDIDEDENFGYCVYCDSSLYEPCTLENHAACPNYLEEQTRGKPQIPQRFARGTRVRIGKLDSTQSHFPQECDATVEYTHSEHYHRYEYPHEYSLRFDDGSTSAWYDEADLEPVAMELPPVSLTLGALVIIKSGWVGDRWGTLLGLDHERTLAESKVEDWAIVGLPTGEVVRVPVSDVRVPSMEG